MSLSIFGECLDQCGSGSYPYVLSALTTMRKPPFGMIARLRGASVCKTNDYFILTIDVPWTVCGDGAGNLGYIQYTFFALFYKEVTQDSQIFLVRSVAGARKDSIPFVRLVILLDEVANVDLLLPEPY